MNYRAHIDGLRAVAILLVLSFHGGLNLFPSGFIGVDIFFVISGFLITGIIQKSLDTNQFSFVQFYCRRLWRLQPVFICLIAITTISALIFFLPDDLVHYSKSARKTALFISNQFFAKVTGGYFAPTNNELPLLHTWSLSIEWQCYLILPIALYLIHRIFGRKNLPKVIYGLTLTCILISLYYSINHTAQTYYLFLSRIFEFLIGSCVALTSFRLPSKYYLTHFISSTALIILLYLATRANLNAGFPNGYTIILCAVTGLLIVSGEQTQKNILINLLSSKPIVFIGLISYSLYIWHWPIFALSHYKNMPDTPFALSLTFLIVFIIAYLSWRFIEKPTRKLTQIKTAPTFIYLLVLPALVFYMSNSIIKKSSGFPQRFKETAVITAQLKQFASPQRAQCLKQKNIEVSAACTIGDHKSSNRKGFMIGDSFSNHSWRFVEVLAEKAHVSILAHSIPACLTLPGIAEYDWWNDKKIYQACVDQTRRYYKMIKENHYDFVLLGQSWNGYVGDKIINQLGDKRSTELTQQRIEKGLDEALSIITTSGAKPIIIKTIVLTKKDPFKCFYLHLKMRASYDPEECSFNIQPEKDEWFNQMVARMQVKYPQLMIIDPQKVQCPQGHCTADINNIPVFRDKSHLTDYAAYFLGQSYLQHFKNPLVG